VHSDNECWRISAFATTLREPRDARGRRVRSTLNKPPDRLGAEEIRRYQLFLLNEKRVKLSSYIQAICALRFFYQNTLHRRIEIDRIPLPRYEKKLPVILSKAEVKALLDAPQNVKHRAMLTAMYGAGLRVSEVASLKVSDLDRERRVIWVRGGKGHKDREVMLADPLRDVLGGLLALEAPDGVALPRQKAGLSHHQRQHFQSLRRRSEESRDYQTDPSAFAAPLCRVPDYAACWCASPDSCAFEARRSGIV
jgi:integrase